MDITKAVFYGYLFVVIIIVLAHLGFRGRSVFVADSISFEPCNQSVRRILSMLYRRTN